MFFIPLSPVLATNVFFETKEKEMKTDREFEVVLLFDTENESINAMESEIIFSSNISLKKIQEGNSIISLWVEKPRLILDNKIIFSGITPGGYIGEKGMVLKLIFKTEEEGKAFIQLKNLKTLKHDGEGTEVNVNSKNLELLILDKSTSAEPIIEKIKDTHPPEYFEAIISRDENIFEGKYFLVFNTQDKGFGIDYYEVKEGERPFVRAESPYLLENQDLNEDIIVRVVDRIGNERRSKISVFKEVKVNEYKKYLIFAIMIISLLVIYLLSRIVKKLIKNVQK